MQIRNAYLFLYNLCQSIGWFVAFYQLGGILIGRNSFKEAYVLSGETVCLFQLAAFLEVAHALFGVVKGSPVMALMQWAGRSNVLFAIVRSVPEVQNTIAVGAMLIAWSAAEIVRYPWYAANIAGASPFWLTWLRYTAFIPLYPVGVLGEMKSMYDAIPYLRERSMHSIRLPNTWNFAFDYSVFISGLLLVYPLLWWQLYSMMFLQRRKRLNPGEKKQL